MGPSPHGRHSAGKSLPWVSQDLQLTVHTLNPLRAKFFGGNIKHNLHFMSFLYIDMTQVVEILPQIRRGPTHSS